MKAPQHRDPKEDNLSEPCIRMLNAAEQAFLEYGPSTIARLEFRKKVLDQYHELRRARGSGHG